MQNSLQGIVCHKFEHRIKKENYINLYKFAFGGKHVLLVLFVCLFVVVVVVAFV